MSDVHLVPILYVDDEPSSRTSSKPRCTTPGFSVVLATTPAEALEALKSPELRGLVTDINLADPVDGWEVARHARETTPRCPWSTSAGSARASGRSRACPQSLMIAKPFAPRADHRGPVHADGHATPRIM
jgi:CheY-like chemotaxis protein